MTAVVAGLLGFLLGVLVGVMLAEWAEQKTYWPGGR